jgi:FdrA protein
VTRKPVNAADGAGGFVRGLFSGGTLAYEAVQSLQMVLPEVYSNTPLRDSQRLEDPLHSRGHTILDMGDDHFTVGRLHPMIDQDLRLRRLRQEAHDPEVGVLMLDVILGEGAHPDPASEIATVLREVLAYRPGLPVAILLVGTDEDPQDAASQTALLAAAGARVFGTLAETVEFALDQCGPTRAEPAFPPVSGLQPPFQAINVGLEMFYESLRRQGARATHVDWRPPAGGNEELLSILSKMKG